VSVTQQQVLDSLSRVTSPRGVPLTNANVLSAISVSDGKVFFSINVDAAEARAWENVRAQAEIAQAQRQVERGGRLADAALARGHRDDGGDATCLRESRTCCCVTLTRASPEAVSVLCENRALLSCIDALS